MTLAQALRQLHAAGTAQNRKIYARHGVKGEMYGVSFAALKKLAKTAGSDMDLARRLWATTNHDARVLATMVADPGAFTSRELDAWVRELDNYVVTDAFGGLVARSPHARRKVAAWKSRKREFVAASAWNVLASLALHDEALARRRQRGEK